MDGTRVRGSGSVTVEPRHLLGAIDHGHRVVPAQREVGCKTNDITEFAPLLPTIYFTGAVVTADAMHAQRAHANYLVAERAADYLLTVKVDRPGFRGDLIICLVLLPLAAGVGRASRVPRTPTARDRHTTNAAFLAYMNDDARFKQARDIVAKVPTVRTSGQVHGLKDGPR